MTGRLAPKTCGLTPFTEAYRVLGFARNNASGDFSYLWYDLRFTEVRVRNQWSCEAPDSYRYHVEPDPLY